MLKFALVTFLIATLTSFFIFSLYNNSLNIKEDLDALAIEESNNISRCGVHVEKFRLCSYPEPNLNLEIARDENESHSGGKAIRISFKGNSKKDYAGAHLYLTLGIGRYLSKGSLEFWIKGRKKLSVAKDLMVYLKEGPNLDNMVGVSLPVKINADWQRLSIPLREFSLVKEDEKATRFTWEIQEIFFSVRASDLEEQVELFIDDLKVINNGKIIYDLS